MEDNNLMNKECYIYNMDETGKPLDHKQPKCITLKGIKKFMDNHQETKVKVQSLLVLMLYYYLW